MYKKILLIQLKQIGDVLMTTPAVRALSKAYPEAEIHYLTQPPSDQIFRQSPYVQKIHILPKSKGALGNLAFIKQMRSESYDLGVDFMGLPKTALLAKLFRVKRRIGFQKKGRSLFYSDPVLIEGDEVYSAVQKTMLLDPLKIPSQGFELDFFTSEEDRTKASKILESLKIDPDRALVSISPVSRREYKVWPAERFAAIADRLIEEFEAQVLFLWGPGEYGFIEAVRSKMKHKSLPDYDIPTISETKALLERVDLHFGNDNGPMHFAVAAGVKTLAVFGKPRMINWIPPESKLHFAIEKDPGCKTECFYPKCGLECLDIDVEEVYSKVCSMLDTQSKKK